MRSPNFAHDYVNFNEYVFCFSFACHFHRHQRLHATLDETFLSNLQHKNGISLVLIVFLQLLQSKKILFQQKNSRFAITWEKRKKKKLYITLTYVHSSWANCVPIKSKETNEHQFIPTHSSVCHVSHFHSLCFSSLQKKIMSLCFFQSNGNHPLV